ncbi:MAG: Hsp20/alpha crystallin family protein [Firmicutes bacterium]|nr:Hsp20/alpha crystallin family protein [Bacillota bacterium]
MALIRWDPFQDLWQVREQVNRLFDHTLSHYPFASDRRGWQPVVDIYEDENEITVKAELPGVNRNDIDITITANSISLRGELRREEEHREEGYIRSERRFGQFFRTLPLPAEVKPEEARASFRDGILEIRAPKAEPGRNDGYKLKIEE